MAAPVRHAQGKPQLTADQLRTLLQVVDDWLLLIPPDPPSSAHPANVKEIRRVLAEQLLAAQAQDEAKT